MKYKITEKWVKEWFFDDEWTIEFIEASEWYAMQLVALGAIEPIIDNETFKWF